MAAKSEVSVKWTGDKQFVGVDTTKHSVVMSAHDPANGTGLKPSDMLLLALGGCSAVDVVSILMKQRKELTRFEIRVTGEQEDQGWPRPFTKIHVQYTLAGKGLTEKSVERAIALSHDTYCSVGSTVSGVSEVTHSFQIVDQD